MCNLAPALSGVLATLADLGAKNLTEQATMAALAGNWRIKPKGCRRAVKRWLSTMRPSCAALRFTMIFVLSRSLSRFVHQITRPRLLLNSRAMFHLFFKC